jgi:thiamine biosynthesis lipoprotein
MKRGSVIALLLFAAAALALGLRNAHRQPPADAELVRRSFLAMGTEIHLTVFAPTADAQANARQAEAGVEQLFHDFDARWSPWGDGDLARLNVDLAAGRVVEVPHAMQPLFRRAWTLHELSGGLFEPRIGGLVRLWGFDDAARLPTAPPASSALSAALAALHAAPDYVEGQAYGPAPGVMWDFGAIAKGAVVDQALAQLHAAGFDNAIVDAGGNLAARGRHGARPWHIAIRHPRPESGQRFLATLDVGDEAVNTHGDYERYFVYQGRRYSHILDPADGQPARGFESVTVVDRDGALADAGGAALFVAGPAHWRALADKLGLRQVVVVDAQGKVTVTAALAPRLQWPAGIKAEVVP